MVISLISLVFEHHNDADYYHRVLETVQNMCQLFFSKRKQLWIVVALLQLYWTISDIQYLIEVMTYIKEFSFNLVFTFDGNSFDPVFEI